MATAVPVETIQPIGPTDAEQLARTEYARFADQLRSLSPGDWTRPTDCPLWDVRAVAGHTAGMLATFTGYTTMMRSMAGATLAARRSGAPMIDMLTAKQVADHAELATDALIDKIDRVGPTAAHWRTSRPSLFRKVTMAQETSDGEKETWRMAYLLDTILTRDPWMHRVDITRAVGCDMTLTDDHDGRLVADVVAEWARRHGSPFTLTLTGPAGGTFTSGEAGDHLELDAVEFCRIVSGRATGEGLLTQEVPF